MSEYKTPYLISVEWRNGDDNTEIELNCSGDTAIRELASLIKINQQNPEHLASNITLLQPHPLVVGEWETVNGQSFPA